MSNSAAGVKPGMIFKAISNVMQDVGFVAKDKLNRQQGFKFRSVDDVYNALHPALAKNKVFIVPRILEQKREVVGTTKNGTKMTLVICKIKFTFYAEDGSSIETVIIGEGLDTGDKATNKAMAVAYKYACFQVFCIPTEEMDDPDSENVEMKKDEGKASVPEKPASASKKSAPSNKEAEQKKQEESSGKITEAMLNTIRSEQKRTGVADKTILSMKAIKAKKIEDMTIDEFNFVMQKFEKTPDLKREEDHE